MVRSFCMVLCWTSGDFIKNALKTLRWNFPEYASNGLLMWLFRILRLMSSCFCCLFKVRERKRMLARDRKGKRERRNDQNHSFEWGGSWQICSEKCFLSKSDLNHPNPKTTQWILLYQSNCCFGVFKSNVPSNHPENDQNKRVPSLIKAHGGESFSLRYVMNCTYKLTLSWFF